MILTHSQKYDQARDALNYISLLEDGWLEEISDTVSSGDKDQEILTYGEKFSEDIIQTVSSVLLRLQEEQIDAPFVYPYEDNDIILEWSLIEGSGFSYAISMEIDACRRKVTLQKTNVGNASFTVEEFPLDEEIRHNFASSSKWLKDNL